MKKPFSTDERLIRLRGKHVLEPAKYIPFLHADKRRDGADGYGFYTYHEGALSDTGMLENVVLDIDLDYFCWDNSLSTTAPKRIEITKKKNAGSANGELTPKQKEKLAKTEEALYTITHPNSTRADVMRRKTISTLPFVGSARVPSSLLLSVAGCRKDTALSSRFMRSTLSKTIQ